MPFRFKTESGRPLIIRAILAMDRQGIIGYDNQLIFNNPKDLEFFKTKTMKHTIVMGWKTFESMNHRILPGRQTVILSRHADRQSKIDIVKEAKVPKNTPEPILTSKMDDVTAVAEKRGDLNVYIIGGASIYDLFAPYVCTWVVTQYNIEVASEGVAYGLLPENYEPKKLVKFGNIRLTSRSCGYALDSGEFISPSGKPITYTMKGYQKVTIVRPMTENNLVSEIDPLKPAVPPDVAAVLGI